MLGPPRNRLGPSAAAVLAISPPGSSFRGWAFAARAEPLWEDFVDADQVRLAVLAEAGTRELGRSTRIDRAFEALEARNARTRRAVLLLTDGRVPDKLALRGLRSIRGTNLPVYIGMLGDESASDELRKLAFDTGGMVLALGEVAEAVIHGEPSAPLEERLLAVFRPHSGRQARLRVGPRTWPLGPLVPGESITWTGPIGRYRPRVGGIALRAVRTESGWSTDWTQAPSAWSVLPVDAEPGRPRVPCRSPLPATLDRGLGSDETPIALAERRCRAERSSPHAPTRPHDGRGVPAETVLRSLRERVIPRARDCLRRDRAGRANYSVRATYEFELAYREVESLRVTGSLPGPLRSCLEGTLDGFEVPYFEGRVVVTYPVYTMAEAPPPRIELRNEVARRVDEAVGPFVDLESLLSRP